MFAFKMGVTEAKRHYVRYFRRATPIRPTHRCPAGKGSATVWAVACLYIPGFPLRVEMLRSPQPAGTPIALLSDEQQVLWASAEAARSGVVPSMPSRQAVALCRNLVTLPHDPAACREAWNGILKSLYA